MPLVGRAVRRGWMAAGAAALVAVLLTLLLAPRHGSEIGIYSTCGAELAVLQSGCIFQMPRNGTLESARAILILTGCATLANVEALAVDMVLFEKLRGSNGSSAARTVALGLVADQNGTFAEWTALSSLRGRRPDGVLVDRKTWRRIAAGGSLATDNDFWDSWAARGPSGYLVSTSALARHRPLEAPQLVQEHGDPYKPTWLSIDEAARISARLLPQNPPDAVEWRKRTTRPLVSVITPVYNTCSHEWACSVMQSLFRQSLADFEWVVVDDGTVTSPCAALQLLADAGVAPEPHERHVTLHWAHVAPRCGFSLNAFVQQRIPVHRIAFAQNQGLGEARNLGVAAATGFYVLFLDLDDLLDELALEKLAWVAALWPGPRDAYVYSGTVHFGDREPTATYAAYNVTRLRQENFLTATALVPRHVFAAAGGNCPRTHVHAYEDWDFWLRLAALRVRGTLLREPLFWYRRHAHGQSAAISAVVSHNDAANEVRTNNPSLFGELHAGAVRDLLQSRSPRPPGAALPRGPLPCLVPLALDADRRLTHVENAAILKTLVSERPMWLAQAAHLRRSKPTVVYVVPWLVVGGAEVYDLNVLEALRPHARIVLVVERHLDEHPWRTAFGRLVDELWFLQTMTNSTAGMGSVLERLLITRGASLMVVGRSSAGYDAAMRIGKRCTAMEAPQSDPLCAVHMADIVHMADPDRADGWDWRSTRAAPHLWLSIATNTPLAAALAAARGNRGGRVATLLPAVDVPAVPAMTSDGNEPHVVVFLGRLDRQKDPLLWLETVQHLAAAPFKRAMRFLVIGDGPLGLQVRRRVDSLAESVRRRITLAGALDHADALAVIARAASSSAGATVLFTSRFDGLSIAALEAVALGAQLVALACDALASDLFRSAVWGDAPAVDTADGPFCQNRRGPLTLVRACNASESAFAACGGIGETLRRSTALVRVLGTAVQRSADAARAPLVDLGEFSREFGVSRFRRSVVELFAAPLGL